MHLDLVYNDDYSCINRIRNTRVIIFGADGLAAELAKNLTLVGIKSLDIMDNLKVHLFLLLLLFISIYLILCILII